MHTVPRYDTIDSSSEDGTHNMVPSSVQQPTHRYTSSLIDDSTLVTVIPQKSSISTTHVSHSHPGSPSPSSPHVDGGVPLPLHRVKRSRSISSHSSSSDTDSDDDRASKRHHSDSDEESVMMNDEPRVHHEPVILKYEDHAIRVLMTNDGTRVVVAKDFLLLTGISKENCARTTKNLVEGRDKRMMHVPSNYCMNKGQQAVVLTLSGLSQLLVTSRRLKQSSVLQAWIKQTLMPVLRDEHTPTPTPMTMTIIKSTPTSTSTHPPRITSSTDPSPTPTSSRRTIVVAKRSKSKSPSTSPVTSPAATPSPRSLSRDASPNSNDEIVNAPHDPLHDLSAAAAAMLNIAPITMPKPINISTSSASPPFLGFPMSTGFSTRVPTFPYRRTPLMGAGVGAGMGAGMVLPRFTHPAAQLLGVRAVGA